MDPELADWRSSVDEMANEARERRMVTIHHPLIHPSIPLTICPFSQAMGAKHQKQRMRRSARLEITVLGASYETWREFAR